MLNIIILAVGKIKESFWREAIDEYKKRLSPYGRVVLHEVEAESFSNKSSQLKAKNKEGERLLKFLQQHPRAMVYALDERGEQYFSSELAKALVSQTEPIIFVIGGTVGLSETVLNYSKNKISLSNMTLPHEMARVILLEQIYRGLTIIKGKDYHY